MFVNKVEPDKGELEIVYDVQWKTPGNDDDKAKIIGIVDTPDTNLDWNTFKSYLIQNSGNMNFTTDDIRISYLDSDDDLIRIDSELEFRECLKFSRTRARRGRKIVMKVNMISNTGAKPKDSSKYSEEYGMKSTKPRLFCLKKKDIPDKLLKKPAVSFEKSCSTSDSSDSKDYMPKWFEKYMSKFKAELVEEITSAVMTNVRSAIGASAVASGVTSHSRSRSAEMPPTPPTMMKAHHHHHHLHNVLEKRKKKKKMPEDDSSDCTDNLQFHLEQRLRHMQKINKRERKFEKKLDAKLEKLESKTKQIMEKKHCLFGGRRTTITVPAGGSRVATGLYPLVNPPPPSAPTCELVMDAAPVDEYNYVPHVLKGETVDQVWKVMNNGQLSWTNETELRFAWGSKSLVPLTTVVKCPVLKPGETGRVKVTLQAPMFPGNFESYWHFHHQGRRFGHWLGCAVIVDPDTRAETPPLATPPCSTLQMSQCFLPVDLTMKCHKYTSYNKISTTDDMKIFNSELNQESQDDGAAAAVNEAIEEETVKKEVGKSVTDVSLEDYPRLETYTDLLKPDIATGVEAEPVPDLVQRNGDKSTSSSLDVNLWSNYFSYGKTNMGSIPVADLLNINKDGDGTETGVAASENMCDAEEKIENVTTGVAKMKIDDDEKKITEQAAECLTETYDYVSGSDSDNISVISGTVSVDTDDSEPSDEFIVVQMPACLNCDQSLDSSVPESLPVTQPIRVEIPKTPSSSDISAHSVQASDNNNNMELKAYPPAVPVFAPVLVTGETVTSEPAPGQPADEMAEKTEAENDNTQQEQHSEDENTVYIKDANGRSVPVAKVVTTDSASKPASSPSGPKVNEQPRVGFGIGVGVSHSTFGDPNFGHGPNGPRFPFVHEPSTSPPHCHNPGGPCNFRPQHESPPCSVAFSTNMHNVHTNTHFCQKDKKFYTTEHATSYAGCQARQSNQQKQQSSQQQQFSQGKHTPLRGSTSAPPSQQHQHHQQQRPQPAASAWTHVYQDIHTEQPRPSRRYSYVHTGSRESVSAQSSTTSNASGSRRSTVASGDTSPVAAAVQILPETLVTGAVNVASSAINTARSVIDMLRPRHEEPTAQQWEPIPPAFESSLRTLDEMGFTNSELNIMLLTRYNNDVTRVISELVQ